MRRYTSRTSRGAGPEMPEQDPTVQRLNAEAEEADRAEQAAAFQKLGMLVGGVALLAGVAILLRRRREEKEDPQ